MAVSFVLALLSIFLSFCLCTFRIISGGCSAYQGSQRHLWIETESAEFDERARAIKTVTCWAPTRSPTYQSTRRATPTVLYPI